MQLHVVQMSQKNIILHHQIKPDPVTENATRKPEPATIKKPNGSTISNNNKNALSKITNPTELKKQYRKLALQYHPDRNQSEGSKERFQNLDKIYTELKTKFPDAQF